MGYMMRWASMEGWMHVTREGVYDQVARHPIHKRYLGELVDHMDAVYNAFEDEQAAAMAGVMFADNEFMDTDTTDSWS